jgi:uncharacterized protein with NRDE domain
MCVVAIALDDHPRWRLVLAGNRDEFHARPSAPLARWDGTDSHIIGGRDLQSGGTWLGVSEAGRLAVVTNIRTGLPPDPDKTSRGAVVADCLHGKTSFDNLGQYNPFSLFALDGNTGWFVANRPQPLVRKLESGVHSLSNGLPDQIWPRRECLHFAMSQWLQAEDFQLQKLLDLLSDEAPLSDEAGQSPIFIRNEHYGTRCSTVVAVDRLGQGTIIERRFGPDGSPLGETQLTFNWPA